MLLLCNKSLPNLEKVSEFTPRMMLCGEGNKVSSSWIPNNPTVAILVAGAVVDHVATSFLTRYCRYVQRLCFADLVVVDPVAFCCC